MLKSVKHLMTFGASVVFSGLLCLPASADETEDYFLRHTMKRYFPTELTARSLGMGGVYAALKGDTQSITGNPAGLGALDMREVSFSFQYELNSGEEPGTFESVDEDIYRGLILGAFPVNDQWKIGAGVVPGFSEVDNSDDRETENFNIPVAVAYQLNDLWALGYGISYIDDEVDSNTFNGESDSAFLHRFGLMYVPCETFDLGLVGTYGHGDADANTATGSLFSGDRESWSIRGGFAWQAQDNLLVAADVGYENMDMDGDFRFPLLPVGPQGYDEELDLFSIQGGLEYLLNESVTARTGVGYSHVDYDTSDPALDAEVDDSDWFNWSGGLSYQLTENVGLDAAVQLRFVDEVDVLTGVTASIKF